MKSIEEKTVLKKVLKNAIKKERERRVALWCKS
jgi:hypothetical protein